MLYTRSACSLFALMTLTVLLWGCPNTDVPPPTSTVDMTVDVDMPDVDMGEDMQMSGLSINNISPATGPLAGGTEVVITGSGFDAGTTVMFGAVASPSVTIDSETQLTAITPAGGMPGKVDVDVKDSKGNQASSLLAFTYEGDVETPVFCRLQAQSPVTSVAGQAVPDLYVVVFADGITEGDGQGAGVTVELGYGMGAEYAQYQYSAAGFNVDKDGLTPGDKANDEYGGAFTVDAQGTYAYAARVKVPSIDDEWIYCDLDGSANGVEVDQLGVLEVQEAFRPRINFCALQNQVVETKPNEATPSLFALVYAETLTNGDGQGQMIEAELGWGSVASDYENFTYAAMTYNTDKDGLAANDKANDEYGLAVTIPTEGDYVYAARFRIAGEQDWFYCDVDGHDDNDPFETDQLGSIKVTAAPTPMISFCQTETASVSIKPNESTGPVNALLYAKGITDMAGQGAGVTAELVWGDRNVAPTQWTQRVTAQYLEDVDGLAANDNANDRYSITWTPAMEGDYGFAYRFSLDGGQSWSWCDTQGNPPASFDVTKLGALDVKSNNLPDSCALQYPSVLTQAVKGQPLSFFGRVYEQGLTDVTDGDAAIRAELWVGPVTADPVTQPGSFSSYPATFKGVFADDANQDEYEVTFTPMTSGSYQFLFRFSVDNGTSYQLCDLGGVDTTRAFDGKSVGALEVVDAADDAPDYCHVFQTNVTKSLADPNPPIFTMEVYEGGITDGADNGAKAAQLDVEFGYGLLTHNPALPMGYTWVSAPFARVNGNNYEYEVMPPYAPGMPPALGSYGVVARIKKSADSQWVYCDNFNQTMDFLIGQVSTLEILP